MDLNTQLLILERRRDKYKETYNIIMKYETIMLYSNPELLNILNILITRLVQIDKEIIKIIINQYYNKY